jgi:ABC-2 type transport system permease protein
MSVATALLRKEFQEVVRTWRLPTVMGVLAFFAVMSPLAALATPALLASVTTAQPGLVIKLPDPTYADSYAQWIKNLSQIGVILVVFSSAGLLSGERASGTAALVLSKPVPRTTFVVAKFAVQSLLVVASTSLATAITQCGTFIAFGEAPFTSLWYATGAWLAGAVLAVALATACSAALPTLAAGVIALGVFALGGLGTLWEPATKYTPLGLFGAPGALLAGDTPNLAAPLLTTVLVAAALIVASGAVVAKREL